MHILMGVFFVLHGLVHLLYFAHSRRAFELRPGLVWPDGSWAFSTLLGQQATRLLACIALGLTALGFVLGAIGLLSQQAWWRSLIVSSAIFSSVLYLLFWDGKFQMLDGKGAIGILINAAIVIAVVVLKWPA